MTVSFVRLERDVWVRPSAVQVVSRNDDNWDHTDVVLSSGVVVTLAEEPQAVLDHLLLSDPMDTV